MLALGVPRAAAKAVPTRDALRSALSRARAHLASLQRADGAWEVDVDQGETLLAGTLIVERRLGVLTERDACAGARSLLAAQRADGSFAAYPGASTGGLLATAVAAAALHATRVPKARAAIARADAWGALSGGSAGIAACFAERMDPSVLFLVAADRLDASVLPEMPAEILTTPFDRLVDRRTHPSNVLGMLVVMALREAGALCGPRLGAIRARIESLLTAHVTAEGGFYGWAFHTLTCLVGLAASGARATEPVIASALAFLGGHKRHDADGKLRIAALGNDVLSTAHAVRALGDAAETRGASEKGAAYLVARQSRVVMPQPNQRKPGAPRTGGWSMHGGAALFPDTDTTAAVVGALARRRRRDVDGALADSASVAMRSGVDWLVGMQNPSGGFPTFVWDLCEKPSGPLAAAPARLELGRPASVMHVLFDPPPEIGDPALEGVTGRVLGALGLAGFTRRDPIVSRAISFLHHQQCEHGGFWGRWMTCYLAETATIVLGLAAVGEDTRLPWVERAVDFLLSHQNADGGWGELPDAYADPSLAGVGPSMPAVTAYVLHALLAVSDPPYEAIHAGVRWLVANQRADGGWDNAGFLHVWLLPDHLYEYAFPALSAPIVALARYLDRLEENVQLVSSTRRKRRLAMRARVLAAHRATPP